MSNEDIIKDSAIMLSDIAQISIEEATEILKKVMEEYKIKDNEIDDVVNKLNEV